MKNEKQIKILEHGTVTPIRETPFNYYAWPSIARLPNNALIMVCSGCRMAHIDPFGKVVACYSFDEGKSWTPPAILFDSPLDDRDAGIIVAKDHVAITTFNNSRAMQAGWDLPWLTAAQKNFIKAYLAMIGDDTEDRWLGSWYIESLDGGFNFNKPRKILISAPHGGCSLQDGRVLYIGTAFKDAKVQKNYDLPDGIYCIFRNTDGSFTQPVALPLPENLGELEFFEPHCTQLSDGRILAVYRVQNPSGSIYNTWISVSDNNGKTFSVPKPTGIEGAPAHVMQHSSGAVVLTYGYRKGPYGTRVRISTNRGETWGQDFILRNDGPDADLGYPATVELKDGSLFSVYYQRVEVGSDIMYTKWEIE